MTAPRTFSGTRKTMLLGIATALALISAAMPGLAASEQATSVTRTGQPDAANALPAPIPRGEERPSNLDNTSLEFSNGPGNPLWAVPFTSLTAIWQRPIFSRSRRPRAVVAVPSIQSGPPPAVEQPRRPLLTLVGAIAGHDGGIAIFVDETTKGTVRLKTGEGYSGWTLQYVEGRQVTMQRNHQTAILALPNPPAK